MSSYKTLRQQVADLRPIKNCEDLNLDNGYSILPQATRDWGSAERRILFVLESADGNDIRAGRMFAPTQGKRGEEQNLMVATFPNVLEQAWNLYQEYLGNNSLESGRAAPDFCVATTYFNACKYYHLKDYQRTNAMLSCAKRAIGIAERMKPTDVIICGDTAAYYMLPQEADREILPFKRGWVVDRCIGKHECKVTTTLDIEQLYNVSGDDEDDSGDDSSGPADLLYYVCRNWCNAFAGHHLHSIAHVKPNPVPVDTMDKFDKLYRRLVETDEPIGFDTETAGLEAYSNKFFTHQYAFDPSKAYVLFLDHPNTPFNATQLDIIKTKLAKFWAARSKKNRKLIVGMNLAFDLKVVRAQLNIPLVYHQMWDVAAGELLLDENIALFDRKKWRVGMGTIKTTQGNLRAITTAYGNDYYWPKAQGGSGPNDFGKDNRATIGHLNITTDRSALSYCAMDAQGPLALRLAQLERADKIRLTKTRTYRESFERHVSNQMSNTVHSISHMHQNGSHIDMPYMEMLASAESPLLKVKAAVNKELNTLETVADANKILLKAKKMRSTGLFGQATSLFDVQKGDSLPVLFFNVLGLKPLKHTDTGQPSIDKKFLAEYAPTCREAELVADYRVAQKLHGTYVKGWLSKMKERLDCALDNCLRPSFGFFIVTGRLNSFDPNLQQVPSRGSSASIIKKAFVPRKNRVNMAWDFNAAEVRFAAVLSGDTNLAEAFLIGTRLRVAFIQSMNAEEKAGLTKRLKTEGDVHIANVKKFFGIWVDKNHPLRSAIKGVVFGALYGLSIKSLARDLELEAKYRHRGIVLKLEKEIAAVKKQLKELEAA